MKPLLDRNVDAISKMRCKRTSIKCSGNQSCLYRKDDSDSKDNQGRTTVSKAAGNGAEAVVKLLLNCQFDANYRGRNKIIKCSEKRKCGGNTAVVRSKR